LNKIPDNPPAGGAETGAHTIPENIPDANPDINQVRRLEEIARHSMEALELCASMGDYQSSLTKFRNRKDIFERAVQGLRQIVPIAFYAFYSVSASDFDIVPEHTDQPEWQDYIGEVVDFLIEKNVVARAFREKRTLSSRSPDKKYHLLIHELTTTARPYGLFICFLENVPPRMSIVDKITTIVTKSACYALENFDLYRLIDQKNAELTEKNLRLSRSEIIYRNTFENTGNPTVIADKNGTILFSNSRFLSFSGWERSRLEGGKKFTDFIIRSGRFDFRVLLREAGHDNPSDPPSYVFETGCAEKRMVFLNISSLGIDGRYIISITDVTTIKDAEKKLQHQALHDPLTGLPNRTLLQDRLRQAVKKKRRNDHNDYALIFIDLDRFKSINDTLGHAAGDELLIRTGERLRESLRDVDTVSRFGGDEFVILLEGISERKDCDMLARRIMDSFATPIGIGDRDLFINMSMGILISSHHDVSEADVIRLADMSMYEAKKRGQNRIVYSHEIEEGEIEQRLHLENELQKGIREGAFFIQYQPLIRLDTNELYGVEALVRWRHPELGIIPPNTFIPIAEESGLIIPLGKKILELAFTDFAGWMNRFGPRGLRLSINLSVRQILHADIAADIRDAAEKSGLPTEHLCIEITESLFIDDTRQVADTISRLKEMGVSISIDDFGTGYSSLKYLNQFSIDMVKIDRLLISNITENKTNFNIVASMLQLCETLNLEVMAEGIEDLRQLEELIAMKCHLGQGYYFSPPRDKAAIEQYIAGGSLSGPRVT